MKNAFTILVMGYNGTKAVQFSECKIALAEEMRSKISECKIALSRRKAV